MQTELSRDGSKHITNEVANTAIHLAAACFAVLGTVLLVAQAGAAHKPWAIVGFSIYGLSLISLFVFSTLHHGLNGSERLNKLLRMFDYLAIFGLVAGTITPVCLLLYRNIIGWSILGVVWGLVAVGVTLRAVFHELPKYITSTLFIVLGWFPAILILLGGVALPFGALFLLVFGGLLYSGGLVLFALEWPNPWPGRFGFHEIWHIVVAAAAFCHFLFMYIYLLPK